MGLMEPFTAMAALAVTAVGAIFGMSGASSATAAQKQQIQLEQQVQQQQQEMMNFQANQQKIAEVRKALMMESAAKTAATNQGAGATSGVAGGQAQIQGQERWNIGNIQTSQDIGNRVFGLTYGIDRAQIQQASAYGMMGWGQGLMSIGGAIGSNMQAINTLGTSAINSIGQTIGESTYQPMGPGY